MTTPGPYRVENKTHIMGGAVRVAMCTHLPKGALPDESYPDLVTAEDNAKLLAASWSMAEYMRNSSDPEAQAILASLGV